MSDCSCESRGLIHLILGPMFSGKTTELFRLTKRYSLAGRRVVLVKYSRDNRYDVAHACTHDLNKMEAMSALNLSDVMEQIRGYDVIGVDEGQFFQDIVECAETLANEGKVVVIAALNGDYQQKPFQNITTLFAMSEKIEKLSAVCRSCGHSASFTHRILHSTQREIIGGEELYRALCRVCLLNARCKPLPPSPPFAINGNHQQNGGGVDMIVNGEKFTERSNTIVNSMNGSATKHMLVEKRAVA